MHAYRSNALQEEMEEVANMCSFIMKHNPDVVITEKGVSGKLQSSRGGREIDIYSLEIFLNLEECVLLIMNTKIILQGLNCITLMVLHTQIV